MVTAPRVSVLIAFLDAGAFLSEAIESVFAQTSDDWEIVLVDDGSSDESTGTARRFARQHPGRVRYLEHEGHANRGISASRNLAAAHARADLLSFLDADDRWIPAKLAEQVAIMDAEPAVDLVFGDTRYWFGWTGKPADVARDYVWRSEAESGVMIPPPGLLLLTHLGRSHAPSMSSIMVRADAWRAIGGFEESFPGLCDDMVFTAKAFLKLNAWRGGSCWDWYRQHERSCCAVADREGTVEANHRRVYAWMKRYFQQEKINDPRLMRTLDRKILALEHPRISRAIRLLAPGD